MNDNKSSSNHNPSQAFLYKRTSKIPATSSGDCLSYFYHLLLDSSSIFSDMLSHVSIRVADLEASVRFYLAALAPLSFTEMRFPSVIGLGPGKATAPIPELWLRQFTSDASEDRPAKPTPVHISFCVDEKSLVDEFHAAGVLAGGIDNGQPGERPWMKGYYGQRFSSFEPGQMLTATIAAYVLDPDGNNIEVVCFLDGN